MIQSQQWAIQQLRLFWRTDSASLSKDCALQLLDKLNSMTGPSCSVDWQLDILNKLFLFLTIIVAAGDLAQSLTWSIVQNSQVIVCTTGVAARGILDIVNFSTVVLDEAAQVRNACWDF